MPPLKLFWWDRNWKSKTISLDRLSSDSDLSAEAIPLSIQPTLKNLLRAIEKKPLVFFSSGTTGAPTRIEKISSLDLQPRNAKNGIWISTFRPDTFGAFDVLREAFQKEMAYLNLFQQWEHLDDFSAVPGERFITTTPSWVRYLRTLNRAPIDGFDRVFLSGEAARETDFAIARELFPQADVAQIYGLTETGTLMVSRSEEFDLHSLHGERIEIDPSGELIVTDKNGNAHRSKDLFKKSANGWVFAGRKDRLFKVGGLWVQPEKVEQACEETEGVAAARITAKPVPVVENAVSAQIVLENGVDKTEFEKRFFRTLASRLERHEIPQFVEYVGRLVDARTGKKGDGK